MKRQQILLVTFSYFLFCLVGILHHELWLDEAHHILLAKESHSLNELIYNSRYEGHPVLWDILIYVVLHVSNNYLFLQLFHILISTGSVYLILKYAPFNLSAKLSIVFGYFMLYEYSVITRNYAISVLFVIMILICLSKERKNLILISGLLALLCNTHLFSCFVAIGFIPALWRTWVKSTINVKIISTTLLAVGLFLAYIQIIPPHDHFWQEYNQESFLSIKRLYKAGWVPLKGLLPIPNFLKRNYWNSNLLIEICKPLGALISVLLLVMPLIVFKKHKPSFFLFYITTIGVILFMYFTPLMFTSRNCGFLSIALFAAVWISKIDVSADSSGFPLFSKIYVVVILSFQLFSGICIYTFDIKKDFSNAKKVGNYLNANYKNDSIPILLTHHSSGPALVLNSKHKILYLESNKTGSFCEWNTFPFVVTDSVLLKRIYLQLKNKKQVVLLTNESHKIISLDSINSKTGVIKNLQIAEIIEFTGATVTSENYYLYTLSY